MSDALVLCYHSISPTLPARFNVTPQAFARQVRGFARRGYRGVTFRDAVLGSSRGRALAVTFDDAYRSVLDHALPVLTELGMPGSVYPVTDLVGAGAPMSWPGIDEWAGGPHESELTGMGWDGLRELAEAGWEVGSHTCRHPWLPDCGDARLADELERSRAAIEDGVGRRCDTLAYPYGGVDARVLAAARAAGYVAAGAIASDRTGDPLDRPRVGVYAFDNDRRLRLKTFGPARRIRARRARGDAWPEPDAAWRLPAGDGA
jgi:peptidoglycan/xylan/chitin deacetylase (PgdA/CDA1 family)